MSAKNKVIAGDYEKWDVISSFGQVSLMNWFKEVSISKDTVETYEIIDVTKRMNATSAISRGLLGSLLLGPVGALAAVSAKKKGTYVIAIQFKDGKKSLLEVNEKIYKVIMKICF